MSSWRSTNKDRPHQALNMKYPGELHTQSACVFAGEDVGIREVSDKIGLVSFMELDLGDFDADERRVKLAVDPFILKVLPILPV